MKPFRRFSFSFFLSSVFSYPTDNPLLTSSQILYYIHSGRGVAGTGKGITLSRNKRKCFSKKLRHFQNTNSIYLSKIIVDFVYSMHFMLCFL